MGVFRKELKKLSDEELMRLLSTHRKNAALTELHARYAKRILGFFIRMFIGDVDKAQDFTQDLLMRILEKHEQFNPERKFYSWMFTIASNMCKTEFRKQPNLSISDKIAEENTSSWDEIHFDKAVFHDQLKQAIDVLEEHHKLTFVLRYLEELPIKEIAQITETSEGTVKSRLFYATKKITERLEVFNPKVTNELFKLN